MSHSSIFYSFSSGHFSGPLETKTHTKHVDKYATIFLLNLFYAVVLKTAKQKPAVIFLDKCKAIIITIIAIITFIINMFNPFVCKLKYALQGRMQSAIRQFYANK